MPTYDYGCKACGHEFEREQRISDKPVKKCPACGKLQAKRLISRTSFVLKGGGWYSDLYASGKPGGASKESGESAESKTDAKTEGGADKKDSGTGSDSGAGASKSSGSEASGSEAKGKKSGGKGKKDAA